MDNLGIFFLKVMLRLGKIKRKNFQERVQAKDPPSHYLAKLRTYLDPKASRSHRVCCILFTFLVVYIFLVFFSLLRCAANLLTFRDRESHFGN